MTDATAGQKDDAGKPRWDLLPMDAVSRVVEAFGYGARKYEDNGWRRVPDWRRRYYAAAMRHIVSWWRGERLDPESGIHHLAMATACLLILIEKENDEGA